VKLELGQVEDPDGAVGLADIRSRAVTARLRVSCDTDMVS
jgi:hypothetical protein